MNYQTITINGIGYDLIPTKKKEKQFICQLDGYNYYLGEQVSSPMGWHDAMEWVKNRGMELPNRAVAVILFERFKDQFKPEWYWTSTEYAPNPAGGAWFQYFHHGLQHRGNKTNVNFACGVYKEKA